MATHKCKVFWCNKTFWSYKDRIYHEEIAHKKLNKKKCSLCQIKFDRSSTWLRHQEKVHEDPHVKMRTHLESRALKINVPLPARKVARQEVQKVFDALGDCFGNGIFSKQFRKSGSYSTDTKVLNANEFDFDVPLRFSLEELHVNREGSKVFYHFTQRQKTLNLNVAMRVIPTETWFGIPQGHVEITNVKGDPIVPRLIQEELYKDIKCAVAKVDEVIDVSKEAKGPALTITVRKLGLHHISVDLCPSIATNQFTLADYHWPRPETKLALTTRLIKSVRDVGLHLVPKTLKFWYISVSKAGKALMIGIDRNDYGCRRTCHKLLKADFQTWIGRSKNDLTAISTMIFKHQLFWMNEERRDLGWSQGDMALRYVDMLIDLSQRLRTGKLPNYFNDHQNLLQDKDQQVLNQVANLADMRRQELLLMG